MTSAAYSASNATSQRGLRPRPVHVSPGFGPLNFIGGLALNPARFLGAAFLTGFGADFPNRSVIDTPKLFARAVTSSISSDFALTASVVFSFMAHSRIRVLQSAP